MANGGGGGAWPGFSPRGEKPNDCMEAGAKAETDEMI